MGISPQSEIAARFWSKVRKTRGCWLWLAATTGPNEYGYKYGCMYVDGHNEYAHRISWELHFGEIPAGFKVCHKCNNPPCVRHDHLYLATHRQNMLDASRDRLFAQQSVTHCPAGHRYTPSNVIRWRNHRHCRACKRLRYQRCKRAA